MLESLITSKTRIKMLLKFFTNTNATAYLRGMAEEFGESTNSIRHELNNLSRAGYLISREEGRTILYQANIKHPLYNELKNLVHKYLGIDKIAEFIVRRIGEVELAYIVGDYSQGKDSGLVEVVLVGVVDEKYLRELVTKAERMIKRKINVQVISRSQFINSRANYEKSLLIWSAPENLKLTFK